MATCPQPAAPLAPPAPPRRPVVLAVHGDVRVDDWHWLRDRENPEVIAHLQAENAYTKAMLAPSAKLAGTLYSEIVGRIQETDLSVPVRHGPWLYYTRTVEAMAYPVHCRRPAAGGNAAEETPEQVLLDENVLAQGHSYFALGAFEVSPDHRLLAYSTDTSGAERYTLAVRDLESGADLPEVLENTYYGVAWANDSATLFYTRPDDSMRPHELWRHCLGSPQCEDVLAHHEADERFYLDVGRTKDGAYVVLDIASKTTSEVRLLRADTPGEPFTVVEARRDGIEYCVEHSGSWLLVVTNDEAENFRLMAAPETSAGRRSWIEALPYDPSVRLHGLEVFARHLVLYERAGGLRRVRWASLDWRGLPVASTLREIEQPEEVSVTWGGYNPEHAACSLRYEYTSLVTPRSVYDLDMDTGETKLLKRQPVLGGHDPAHFCTQRLWVRARDGASVPVSLVYRRGVEERLPAPCLLYGYGSYEHSVEPAFSSARLSLLERGVIYAIAHVRGGGEMGRSWYSAGKLAHKHRTFDDFVDVARALVEEGWTAPERLVARGASAGGMLMGAVANRAPELFRAIVAEVPFVDCLTTIMDETLPLTVLEWEEWGNPVADPAIYQAMRAYSPYDNVGEHPYPAMLVTAGLSDPRVGYWEPAKWVAKLRALSPGTKVMLKTEMDAGHGGPSGRYDAWREEAQVLAFILDAVGLGEPGAATGPPAGDR